MIRILAESDEKISIPRRHDLITNTPSNTPSYSLSTTATTKAFTDFPNKKLKIR